MEEGSLTTPDGLPREVDVSQTVNSSAMYPVTIDLAMSAATTKRSITFEMFGRRCDCQLARSQVALWTAAAGVVIVVVSVVVAVVVYRSSTTFQLSRTFGSQEEENDGAPWRFAFDPIVDATWNSARNGRGHDLIFDGISSTASSPSTSPATRRSMPRKKPNGLPPPKENLVGIVRLPGRRSNSTATNLGAGSRRGARRSGGHGREARGLVQALGGPSTSSDCAHSSKEGRFKARSPGAETLTMAQRRRLGAANAGRPGRRRPPRSCHRRGKDHAASPANGARLSCRRRQKDGRRSSRLTRARSATAWPRRPPSGGEKENKKTADPEKKQIDH